MNHGAKVVEAAVEPELDCAGCGYDLRGIASERCPECGRWFDRTGRLTSRLPRARRGWGLGRVRNYLWTAWRVSRRPSWLAGEMEHVVEAGAARRFRWVTVLIAWLTLAAVGYWVRALWYVQNPERANVGWPQQFSNRSNAGDVAGLIIWKWSYWVSAGAALVFFACATAVAGWFVYSRRVDDVRANRAAVLAHYTCAPLAWAPAAAAASGGLAVYMGWLGDWDFASTGEWWVLLFAAPGLVLVAWVWNVLRLVRRATGCGVGRLVVTAVALPVIWAGMAVAIFAAAHGLSTFVLLLLRSWS